jgi:hypothetical protein
MAQLNFDANQVEPRVAFDPLPAGKYLAEITSSEMKPTKAGDGQYLELEFTVIDGEFRERRTWDRLCLHHPKPKTVQMARATLSAVCRAVGVMQPNDSAELHHIPLLITVKCRKDEKSDAMFNEIKGYEKASSALPEPVPAQQPVDSADPPWARTQGGVV